MESSDEVNLKSRFFRVGESSRKDFTFKSFLLLCLELGDSCKLKQCTFVSPFIGNLTLKFTSSSVVCKSAQKPWSLPLTLLGLVFFALTPHPHSSTSVHIFFLRSMKLSVSVDVSWSCSKFSASQIELPWVVLPDLLFSNGVPPMSVPDALKSLSACAVVRESTLWPSYSVGSVSYCSLLLSYGSVLQGHCHLAPYLHLIVSQTQFFLLLSPEFY